MEHRSRLEDRVSETLQDLVLTNESLGLSVEYETEKFKYFISREYTPDFILKFPDGRKIYLEVKGYLRPDDRSKILAVRTANPEIDLRMVFDVDNRLNKKAKMTYSKWCEKHKLLYTFRTIPTEWLI